MATLNERARIVDEVGRIKKARHLPVSDPRRFQEVLDKAAAYGKGPLPADADQANLRTPGGSHAVLGGHALRRLAASISTSPQITILTRHE